MKTTRRRTITAVFALLLVLGAGVGGFVAWRERGIVRISVILTDPESEILIPMLQELGSKTRIRDVRITRSHSFAQLESDFSRRWSGTDIVIGPSGYYLTQFMEQGRIAPVPLGSGFPSAVLGAVSFDETAYAVPIAWSPRGLYFSRELTGVLQFSDVDEFLLALSAARDQNVQALVMPGFQHGTVFDLFVSLYGDQSAVELGRWIQNDLALPPPEPLPELFQRFQSLFQQRVIPGSSDGFSREDVYTFLQQGDAAIVFDDTFFSSLIPVDDRRSIRFSGPPLSGPRRPIIPGRIVAAAVAPSSAERDIVRELIASLGDPAFQYEISVASRGALMAVHSTAPVLDEYTRTARRSLAIASAVLPSHLEWAAHGDRERINDLINGLLIPTP